MRRYSCILLSLSLWVTAGAAGSVSVEEYIKEAQESEAAGDLAAAVETMREAIVEHPEAADAHAYLGLYLGMSAGSEEDFGKQAALAFESFEVLDKAVSLDSSSVSARFNRGIIGINVPEFLGRRNAAIRDLETVIRLHAEGEEVSPGVLANCHFSLANAYEEKGEVDMALAAWERVVELTPESELADRARESISKQTEMSRAQEPVKSSEKVEEEVDDGDPGEMMKRARSHYREREYRQAEDLLNRLLRIDASNPDVYVLLAMTIGMQADQGYDEGIAEDRNVLVNKAFKSIEYLDEAVKLAPESPDIRLLRGILGVELPFFVQRLEQGMEDLEWVVQSSAHDTLKAEALYYLGRAHRKRTLTHWAQVVRDHPESNAAEQVLESLRPTASRIDLSAYERPVVIVDFVLGFQEELPPQTAVWVVDENGDPVRTLYVSGYAGHIGAKEITLPKWSSSTDFETDATTGASIDLGHHVYTWDLKDRAGNRVPHGEYTVWVEVSYWPSMQYELVSATFEVQSEKSVVTVEEGRFIPLLEVICLP